jgi:ribosomal protein S18 acetylase RimI-like enzyme
MIRKTIPEDFPTLAKLFVDNVDDTYITASEEEWGRTINRKWKPNLYDIVFQEMVDRQDNVLILVLIQEEKIAGYLFSSLEPIPHIEDIMIHKSYRGKGFGKLILEYALNTLKAMGFNKFRAEIGINNIASQNMFKKFSEVEYKIH